MAIASVSSSTSGPTIQRDWIEASDPGMNTWHVVYPDGTDLKIAHVNSYSIALYDLTAHPTAVVATLTTTTPALTIFDTLQVDGLWSKDNIGYNVRHYLKVSDWTLLPGHTYRWVYSLITDAY